MPSDKHNSRMARARDLIFSLINIISSRDVPFTNRRSYVQCLHHGATFVSLWSPIFSSQPRKATICSTHIMASMRDIKITEALLILCLAYYVMKQVRHYWNWGVMAFMYWGVGRMFHKRILRIFHNRRMDCRDAFHAVLCLYCCVMDRT